MKSLRTSRQCPLVVGCRSLRVAVWVDSSALWLRVVAAVGTVGSRVDLVVRRAGGVANSASSEPGLVAGTHVRARSRETTGAHLSITGRVTALWLALPELALAEAGSVVVGWRWTVALLLLVVSDQCNLHGRSDDEEEGCDNGHGKSGGVEFASSAQAHGVGDLSVEAAAVASLPVAERSHDIAGARAGAVSSEDCNSNHGANKGHIEDLTRLASCGCDLGSAIELTIAKKAKNEMPPRQQVRMVAQMV